MIHRDDLFSAPIASLGDWTFDDRVAEVFPDMIQSSIPGYSNIISMIGMLVGRFACAGTQIYDLDCALGVETLAMRRAINHIDYRIIAVDNSPAIIARCRCHIEAFRTERQQRFSKGIYAPSLSKNLAGGTLFHFAISENSVFRIGALLFEQHARHGGNA
ncbi:MAG: Carboxy-S-adenosyl-L-methionine synthase [Sodalis sp.]|nr:MAG: Carboxy-S-adenosyl-L-methionine synthase [Sodalis sp.]